MYIKFHNRNGCLCYLMGSQDSLKNYIYNVAISKNNKHNIPSLLNKVRSKVVLVPFFESNIRLYISILSPSK